MKTLEKTVTRKDFFKEIFQLFRNGGVATETESHARQLQKYILPPGAGNEAQFLQQCNQCQACVSACPHFAIQICRDETSHLYGYPVIAPRQQACYLCRDFPCIQACPTDALSTANHPQKLGTARIHAARCLDYLQGFCQSCLNHCPHMGRAIFRNATGQLHINPQHCTGCGICVMVCVQEQSAIEILPVQNEPMAFTENVSSNRDP
ncbi:MAG: hypothetical protein GXO78_10360 [Calditrichaeota bacterium]|nr:hypothetical protein [Calditrichota bacterium]